MKRKLTMACIAGVLVAAGMVPNIAGAQGARWSVFRNCNTRPCTIGVAVSTWLRPGWSRIVTYTTQAQAWRRACQLHYNYRNYNSPDIAAGRVNCARYR